MTAINPFLSLAANGAKGMGSSAGLMMRGERHPQHGNGDVLPVVLGSSICNNFIKDFENIFQLLNGFVAKFNWKTIH